MSFIHLTKSEMRVRKLDEFEQWKNKSVTSWTSALGRVEVTLKRSDGKVDVIRPLTFDEWLDQIDGVDGPVEFDIVTDES